MAVSATGTVTTIASTETLSCWAFSMAAAQSPLAAIGEAMQAHLSPPFWRAATTWVFRSDAVAPSSVSKSLWVLSASSLPTFLLAGPMNRK
ncbi:hypothetical protein D3C80_1985300 [compost metagenome]